MWSESFEYLFAPFGVATTSVTGQEAIFWKTERLKIQGKKSAVFKL